VKLEQDHKTRQIPRRITPDILWTGSCVELTLHGELVHTHFCNYVIRGSEKVLLLDTGHPDFVGIIEQSFDEFLGGRQVDYILPTHCEFPHFGLAAKWLEKYPGAKLVGDVRDYPLYYPEYADRMEMKQLGDRIDLGDREVIILPGVWIDLPDTIWAFDTKDRVLFCSDGFSSTHIHFPGQCGLLASEQEIPSPKMIRLTNEIILSWTRYLDVENTFAGLDRLVQMLEPAIIAPAHGAVIDNPAKLLPVIKDGMRAKSATQGA